MFSRIVRRASKLNQTSQCSFASQKEGGNLYTWGPRSAGLGLRRKSISKSLEKPSLVEVFDNNVVKAAIGSSHSAVVTTNGDLYTFGYGHYGVLGHNDGEASKILPTPVEFFRENDLKVKDVVVGRYHTAALTENGQLYTWGYGGKSYNPIKNIMAPSYGALGLGSNVTRFEPALVEDYQGGRIVDLVSGNNFVAVLTENGDVYHWGEGHNGVFGDNNNRNLKTPTLSEAIHHLKEEEGIKPVKIRACADQILALFDNGKLYGWGYNHLGQLGVEKIMGVELHKVIEAPTPIDDTNLKGKKIIDFDMGENTSMILTENNEVYWAGQKLVYRPELAYFPEDLKIKKIGIANNWANVITEDNKIHSNGRLFTGIPDDLKTISWVTDSSPFNGGQILEIGGGYENSFAIVRQ